MKIHIPEVVFIHYDIAIHMTAKLVWPKIDIKEFRFHLKQNCWKKI